MAPRPARLVVALALLVGCPAATRGARAVAVDAGSDAAASATSATSVPAASNGSPCAYAEAQRGTAIANGRCATNADCVLTDAPAECDACNLRRVYPTLARALAKRDAACGADSGAPACPASCPPRDTDTPAFYRAECRSGRCIAWRYHSGG
jgi:hypothetical protein